MIFSKDEKDDQLPYTHSDRYLYAKVLISAIFLALCIFFVLARRDTIMGVIVISLGIVWNLFLPLGNKYSLVMSVMMGLCYGVVCVSIGLVANAFLYLAYYVPLQYLACRSKEESFILQNKQFSDRESMFILFYYILFFVGVYIFSSSVNSTWLCFVDSATATLLALSALARNMRVKSYYKIRFIALACSIFLWALLASSETFYSGALSILLMYIMYFCHEIATVIYEKRHYNSKMLEKLDQKNEQNKQKLAQKKKEQYKKMQQLQS